VVRAHDLVGADHLLPDMRPDTLSGDRTIDADERGIGPLMTAGKMAVLPSKRCSFREIDREFYKARHLAKQLFAKSKWFRIIAIRYDKQKM
jgi:hypothetical protein